MPMFIRLDQMPIVGIGVVVDTHTLPTLVLIMVIDSWYRKIDQLGMKLAMDLWWPFMLKVKMLNTSHSSNRFICLFV